MKVLIVNTLYHPHKIGGAEVSVQLLAEGLVAAGHYVRVVSLHDQKLKKMEKINGVEISYLPLFNKYWPYSNYIPTKLEKLVWHILDTYNLVMAKRVEQEIVEFKPDVVHTNNLAGFSVAVWSMVKKHNIKLVHTSRDYYLFHPNCNLFKNGKIQSVFSPEVKFWSYLKKRMTKHVDYYVGISEFIQKFHLDNGCFSKEKSNYIYNAVENIKKLKFNDGEKTIGFIGRLSADKGFDDFCYIANKFKKEYNFVAAGRFLKNEESKKLKELSIKSEITLLGFSKLQDFINEVDEVFLPIKWNEPFGRVVVECALAGLNVYTNRIGGITELFDYFENVYDIGDIDFKKGKHHIGGVDICKFSLNNTVASYIKVYEDLYLVNKKGNINE